MPLSQCAKRRFPKNGWILFLLGLKDSLEKQNPYWIEKCKEKELNPVWVWKPLAAAIHQLPGNLSSIFGRGQRRRPLLRSPERGVGLEGVTKKSSRIKEFKLSDAIVYSYFKDIRFVTLVCLLIGFSAWWILVPEQLLEGPGVLCSPPDIARLIKDTFIDQVCSEHHVSSPCDCGEPINNQVREDFSKLEFYDPLNFAPSNRMKAASVLVASVILSLVLAESISQSGIHLV